MKLRVERACVYLLLAAGAALCAFPFLWMLCTSVKVDRELLSGTLHLFPQAPSAAIHSPYIDTTYRQHLPGSLSEQHRLLPLLEQLIIERHLEFPPGIDVSAAREQVARGTYVRLSRMVPQQTWDGPDAPLIAAVRQFTTPELLAEMVRNIDRRLSVGAIRFRNQELEDVEPMADRSVASRWTDQTPALAVMVPVPNSPRRAADLHYDFSHGERVVLQQTFHLPYPAADLQSVQLDIHPDDSWHDLSALIQMDGRQWTVSRTTPLANTDWQTITWQWPSDDDNSVKIKTWVPLEETASASDGAGPTDPHDVNVTLILQRASLVRAWWNKIRLNYQRVMDYIPFWRYLRVSLFLAGANIVLTLLSSSLVAYAFARLHWPGRDLCFALMLATMMVPIQVLMIPQFLIWRSVGAYDTLTPMWVGAAFGNAFFIFLMRQFMRGIPNDLEDAARIDGCGFLRIYWHVMLPLVKPALAAIAIFTFMGSWNDFLGPLLYIADQRLYPLAFGLYAFSIQIENRPALTMAASVLMTFPIILVFLAAQKYFVQGVTLTGLKG